MSNNKLYYSRKWLNDGRGRAHTIAYIDGYAVKPEDGWREPYVDAYFEVADCSDNVSLDFCIDKLTDEAECAKIEAKLSRFRHEFEKFEKSILKAIKCAQSES